MYFINIHSRQDQTYTDLTCFSKDSTCQILGETLIHKGVVQVHVRDLIETCMDVRAKHNVIQLEFPRGLHEDFDTVHELCDLSFFFQNFGSKALEETFAWHGGRSSDGIASVQSVGARCS